MTKSNTTAASKLGVAFVAVAMLLTMVTPAKAATVEELQKMIADLTAQLSALSGSKATPAAASYNFTRSLTVGAKGADVTALQNYLIASGYPLAAGATGYFGAQTAAAVAKWQAANGLTPAVGYFGPKSIAKYNAMGGSASSATSTPSTTLTGGAGTASYSSLTSDVEDDINAGQSENILGFKVEASDSDLNVSNVKVKFEFTGSAGSNRLDRYFDEVKIVMNGTTVATVDAEDFTRDSAGIYTKSVALSNAIVKKGASNKASFYVVAKAVSNIDTTDADNGTWKVSTESLRYSDASGAIISDSMTAYTNSGVNVDKLASSGDVKVKLSLGTSNPDAQTIKVSDDASGDKVTLLEFKVKAEGTDVSFDRVRFVVATTSATLATMVSEFQLVKGSSVVETSDSSDWSATSSSQAVVTFDLDDSQDVDKDATVTYKLVAKMNKNTFSGATIRAEIPEATAYFINAEDANGDTIAAARFSGSVVGNAQTIRGDGVSVAKSSATASLLSKTVSNTSMQYGEFKFTVNVTADGDDFYFASTSDPFAYDVLTSNGVAIAAASSTATLSSAATVTSNGNYVIYDGETKAVTYTVTMLTGASTGSYKANLKTFGYGASAATPTGSTVTLTPASTFTTDTVTIQ